MRINITQEQSHIKFQNFFNSNNITFQSKIIRNNEIRKTFEYNKELLNKKDFKQVLSFCRGLEALLERGPKDIIYKLSSEIRRNWVLFVGTWYSTIVNLGNINNSGGLSSLMQRKNYQEASNLEKPMLSEAIITIGESNIKNDCDEFANEKFNDYVFQNLNKHPEQVLSDYGKKLWEETKLSYNRSSHFSDYYYFRFANILKAQDELKTTSVNDIEKINDLTKKIKTEIKEIIDIDYEPIHFSYKRVSPQILSKTKKDFRQFYTGESINTYEAQNLLKKYNEALENAPQTSKDIILAETDIINFLNNWLISLKNNKNLIENK